MSTTEHRPTIDPSILGRMAASMDSIRAGWDADVADLRATKDELASVKSALDASSHRLDDIRADLTAARRENAELIQRNALLRAELDKFGEISLDARNRLEDFANKVARAQTSEAPVAPAAPRLVVDDLADIPPRPVRTHNDDRRERGLQPLRDHDDEVGGDIPMFLRSREQPVTAPVPHRTLLPPVDFGRQSASR